MRPSRRMARLGTGLLASFALLALSACGDGSSSGETPPATEFAHDCFIDVGLTNETVLANLNVFVHYDRAPGDFVGAGRRVECTRLDKRLALYTDDQCNEEIESCPSEQRVLGISALAHHDITTPIGLARCRFGGDSVPEADDFDVDVTAAATNDFAEVVPAPVGAITHIDCRSSNATTTTTTLMDPCEDVSCPDGEACDDGVCVASTRYAIDFAIANATAIGSLQFDVAYECAAGGFDGEGGDVLCAANPELNTHVAFNDKPCNPDTGTATLTSAIISPQFDGPAVVATCEYTSTTREPPAPTSFTITVIDAADPIFLPIPDARIVVQTIRPIAR